jgi:hypothetical protein
MIEIKKIIKEKGLIYKFNGLAPERFVLVHEETLENLKNKKTWLNWKNGIITINELNNKNFNDELSKNDGSTRNGN